MGYQDGVGLRPGRTKDKVTSNQKNDSLGTAANAQAGFRAAGAVSPVRQYQTPPSPAVDTNPQLSGSPLSQFNASPSQPKGADGTSLLGTVGMAVGTKLAGDAVGGLASKGYDYLRKGNTDASQAFMGSDVASSHVSPNDYTNMANGGYLNDGATVASNFGDSAGYLNDGITVASNFGDSAGMLNDGLTVADGAGEALGAAGDLFGNAAPFIGGAMELVNGNIKGAALRTAGAVAGSFFGPIGTVVGGAVGGWVDKHCFITEATMAGLGVQDDNAEPLMVLRAFRDNVMMGTPQGQQMVQEYNDIAPLVVQAVQARPDAMEIFKQIFDQFIAPAVEAIKAQDFPQALQIYAAMIAAVTPLAQQAMDMQDQQGGELSMANEPPEQSQAPDQAQQQVAQLGQDAGMVAQNPAIAQQAAPAPMQGGGAIAQQNPAIAQQPMQPMQQQGASPLNQFTADDEQRPTSVRFGRG